MKIKPKALVIVNESIIMFTKNKTGKWRDKGSGENFKKKLSTLRQIQRSIKTLYIFKRKSRFKKFELQNFEK